jgi:predicted transcriptional regulator
MEQILRKAESQGLIQRVATEFGEKGRFAYISASAARSEISERASTLLERRKQLLSSLTPGKLYYARELASYFGVPATSQIREALIELAKLGLIHTVAVGIKMFCGLTPAGAAHRDYEPSVPKATPVDLVAEIGDRKSKYLQAMKVLGGSARTIDLTYAIGEAVTNGVRNNSGQMMQMLEEVGLVQRPQEKALGQRAYSLTDTGQQVAALLDGYIVPPNRAALEASIALRMEIKADTLRQVAEQTNKRKAKQT